MKTVKFILLFLMVFGCKNNASVKPSKPDNLISQDQMIDILYDMALVSSAKGAGKRAVENSGIDPEAFIYEKHQIDSIQFKNSNAYYSYDVDTYEFIYTTVKQKLEQDKKTFQGELDEEKRKRDSIMALSKSQDSIAKLKRKKTTQDSIKNLNPKDKIGTSQQ